MFRSFWENLTIKQKLAITAWLFLAIPIIFYITIRFYPTYEAFYVSFMKWNLLGAKRYIGFKNYIRIWGDEDFWIVLWNTIKYAIIGVPISLLISFTVAYYLNEIRFGHQTIRALYFIPFLTTAVAMAWVWRWFYQPMPIGYFNIMLSWIGIPQQPFLRSVEQALYSVMAPAVWAGLGFQIVIFIAGLRAIPKSHFEAAEIDGAGRLQILREIILPALKPTTIALALSADAVMVPLLVTISPSPSVKTFCMEPVVSNNPLFVIEPLSPKLITVSLLVPDVEMLPLFIKMKLDPSF